LKSQSGGLQIPGSQLLINFKKLTYLKKTYQGFFSEITNIPSILNKSHYPSLNGLRGVSIILVVASHLGISTNRYYAIVFNGELGVNIFFVLSGFLITTLCIKEKVTTGNISLKNFYKRRILRIFPVAYLYIVVVVVLNFIFKLQISYLSVLAAVFYISDLSYFRRVHFDWDLGHFWSLSIEEQFYLTFPILLKKHFKTYLLAILGIIFLLPIIILFQSIYSQINTGILYSDTHFLIKFQAIAIGCLFSVLTFKTYFNINKLEKLIINLIAIFLIFYMHYDNFFSVRSVFIDLAISLLTGLLIVNNITPGTDYVYRFLNLKILNFIGILSYSIYIWQQLFTSNDNRLPHFMVYKPFNMLFIIVVPCLSYYFYEKFFLKLKAKYK
jgi:peptidoglycan/LPS O-acetylase OafA/YrhL